MNKSQIIVLLFFSIVLIFVAAKDLIFGGLRVPPLMILALLTINAICLVVFRTKRKTN